MKKPALSIALMFLIQLGFCQEVDTVKVFKDTIINNVTIPVQVVTPTPVATPAVAATPAEKSPEASAPKKKDTRPLNEKLGFGLGASFWFSSTTTYVEVAPTLSYRFPKRLTTGIGYRYIYQHDKVYDADLNSYGPLLLARVDLIPRIYFWTEYEHLKNKYISDIEDIPNFDSTTDSWFLGLGITQSVGRKGRGGVGIQVLYNVLYDEDEYSPYSGPFIYRIGFFF
jgi:hypothetical protein